MNGNGIRPQTSDPITHPPLPRERRPTQQPSMKNLTIVSLAVGIFIALGTILWNTATTQANKADKSQVREIEKQVHKIDKEVGIIQSEQRTLLRHFDLPVGKE